MAASATPQTRTHEQIEYEQGLLLENCVPFDVKKGAAPGLTNGHTDERRKPPLIAQGRSRAKTAAGC